MTTITVYNFLVPDIHEGDFVAAKGKATIKQIEKLYGKVVDGSAETIDESMLTDSGRYHVTEDCQGTSEA